MILSIASKKGGSGKSTLAINIATFLATKKKTVVLVDADRQENTANWVNDRFEKKELPFIALVKEYDSIDKQLVLLNKKYDWVVVDTAGHDSKEMRSSLLVSDITIIPVRPSQHDLDTLFSMNDILRQSQQYNPSNKVLALLTMTPTNPINKEEKLAREFIQSHLPTVKLLKSRICDRKIYRDSIPEGKGVVEMGNSKALKEISLLVKEVL